MTGVMKNHLVPIIALLCLLAGKANAQFTYYRLGYGASVSRTFAAVNSIPEAVPGTLSPGGKIGLAVHGAIRFELTNRVYLGTGLSYGRTRYAMSYATQTQGSKSSVGVSLHNFTIPALGYFVLSGKKPVLLNKKWKVLGIAGLELQVLKEANSVISVGRSDLGPENYTLSYSPSNIQFGPTFSFGFALNSPLRHNNLWEIFAIYNLSIWNSQNFTITYAPTNGASGTYRNFIPLNNSNIQFGVSYYPFARRMRSQYANKKPDYYKSKYCPYDSPRLRKEARQSKME